MTSWAADLIERAHVLDEVTGLLERAAAGSGGILVVAGAAGSGRTAVADAAALQARRGGFDVVRGRQVAGTAGRWLWAQLVRDAGGSDHLVARLLAYPDDVDLDSAAAALCAGRRRLVVIDDVDRGGPDAVAVLAAASIRTGRACRYQPADGGPSRWRV